MEKLLLKNPLFKFDNSFLKPEISPLGLEIESYSHILGTDEAGRGPAAGGVWAACVCFCGNVPEGLEKLNDSKKLTQNVRESLYDVICANSIYSIKKADVETIEKINILNASLLAMKMAADEVITKIQPKVPLLLVDGNRYVKNLEIAQKTIVSGDAKSASIAAASVLAKASRDRFMKKIDAIYPQYGWCRNKGYLTKEHIEAIKKHGVTDFHRKSFLKNILSGAQCGQKEQSKDFE